ncbi:taste receptor type 1 member 3-like [Discoglossus pictus]
MSFDPSTFIAALAMKYAIGEINNSSMILPYTKLGYEIHDSFQKSDLMRQAVMTFLDEGNSSEVHVLCNYTNYKTRMIAVIGPSTTEMVMATGKLLGFFRIPQISFDAPSEKLNDKITFPSFLRALPSDKSQAEGMVQLLKELQWNWIAVVASRDEDSLHGLFQFTTYAYQCGICIAYQTYVPKNMSDTSIQDIVLKIQNAGVNVTVVLTSLYETQFFLKSVIKLHLKMVWIASTSWSLSKTIQQLPGIEDIGTIIGFAVKREVIPGFKDFVWNLLNLIEQKKHSLQNDSLLDSQQDPNQIQNLNSKCKCCSLLSPKNVTLVLDPMVQSMAYSIYTAVYCIAQALHNVMNCSDANQCNDASQIFPWQILKELKNRNFVVNNFTFDPDGNANIGYDILTWRYDWKGPFTTVGTFHNNLILKRALIPWHSTEVPKSTCSKECSKGQIKTTKGFHSCCFDCVTCPEGTFANSTECTPCPMDQWSSPGSKSCQLPSLSFLTWSNYYTMALVILMGLIILLIFTVTLLFFQHRHTPVVCASGGHMCFLSLLALIFTCGSIGSYIGKPSDLICQLQQPFLSMGFALLLCPIMVKSMQLWIPSLYNGSWLLWILHQGRWIIIIFTTLGQAVFCAMYIMSSPLLSVDLANLNVNSLEIYLSCKYEPLLPFGLMFAYNGLLVLVSFICSFMAEKPVHQYNMARDITVAMLMMILAWIIFIPTYVSTPTAYKSLIQMCFILCSCLGILGAVFFPKCYILVFKKELNNSEYFRTYISNSQNTKAVE